MEEVYKTNRILRRIYEENIGKSESELYDLMEQASLEHTSRDYFYNDMIAFYPSIKEEKSTKIITCDFSGALIYPGSTYCLYRPFLEDLTTGSCYVLSRSIKVEEGYRYLLPTTMSEFEDLNEQLEGNIIRDESEIDFSHLSSVTGGTLKLQKLKKRKIHKNCG